MRSPASSSICTISVRLQWLAATATFFRKFFLNLIKM
jgi:hypothetical protein